MPERPPVRVGVIGLGAIGTRVAGELARGGVPGAVLTAVLVREGTEVHGYGDVRVTHDPARLADACDLVVEAAGPVALADYAPTLLAAGTDILVVSVGALADGERLLEIGPGRLLICPGALGGVDLLRGVARAGGFRALRLTSEKKPAALVQPWMDDDQRDRLVRLGADDAPIELFRGTPARAAALFPGNLNLAVTAGLAASALEDMEVVLVADGALERTRHTVEGRGPVGTYRLQLEHDPLADQPRTSAVVPAAVLVSVADYVQGPGAWLYTSSVASESPLTSATE